VRWVVGGLAAELAVKVLPGSAVSPPLDAVYHGQLAVVTGATGGVGAYVSLGLAARGFTVCVAARDRRAGEALVLSIRRQGGRAMFLELDLEATPADVARALSGKRLALLVNNAGTMGGQVGRTMRVNLCGPAALTLALLPSLCAGGGRIVNVGSSSHLRAGAVCLSASDTSKDTSLRAYAQSKLGMMHLSLLLRDGCADRVTVHDCHPGIVWTPMLRNHFGPSLCAVLQRAGLAPRLFRSPEQGAATVLWAALAPAAPTQLGGRRSKRPRGRQHAYFANCRRNSGWAVSPQSTDRTKAVGTWRWLVEAEPSLVGLAASAGVAESFNDEAHD